MQYVIEVTYDNQDDVPDTDLYGPFRTIKKAEKERDRIVAALGENHVTSEDLNRSVYAYVRGVNPVRTRPIVAQAREFLKDEEED